MATDSTRRLHHAIPPWVASGAVFHVRIRAEREWLHGGGSLLSPPSLARTLLESVAHYHRQHAWHCHLFLVMPNHAHALLALSYDKDMT